MKHYIIGILAAILLLSPCKGFSEIPSPKKITAWRQAAEQGDTEKQNLLGLLYRIGKDIGVKQDYAESAKWYLLSAKQGNAHGQLWIGIEYALGIGVQKSSAEAVKWYQRAADQGYADAQNNLGLAYRNGDGVRQNYEEALKWLQLAANQNNAGAQYNLGGMYLNGWGVRQDKRIAKEWFGKACDNKDQGGCDAFRMLSEQGY
jgi:uncharacterized protein